MEFGLILPTVLVAGALVSLPVWPHSQRWGYAPSAILLVAVAIVAGLMFLGRSG